MGTPTQVERTTTESWRCRDQGRGWGARSHGDGSRVSACQSTNFL